MKDKISALMDGELDSIDVADVICLQLNDTLTTHYVAPQIL